MARSLPTPRIDFDTVALAAVLVTYAVVSAATLLTFPPYYEDESWTYLAVFEALRGNGFTWAAFGDGRPILGSFLGLVTPAIALVPAGPEAAVRIVSAGWGLLGLAGAHMAAKRLAPSTAWITPALMLSTQYVFVATRYGRTDTVALALTLWSLAAATRERPFAAGLLLGLAVSVHPIFISAAAPCLWFLDLRDRRRVVTFLGGALLGGAPQLLWMMANRADVQAIVGRYAVSSSVAADVSGGILRSIADEPRRYIQYVTAQQPWQLAFQMLAYVIVPLAGAIATTSRWTIGLLVFAPAIGLAALAQSKNPYYFFSVLPFVAIGAAVTIEAVPQRIKRLIVCGVLGIVVTASIDYAHQAGATALTPLADDVADAIVAELPRDATVVSLNLVTGVIRRRPDIQFFNFHALSTRPGWGFPPCDQIPLVIRSLADKDPRPATANRDTRVAYVIAPAEAALTAYLQQIYVNTTVADARCLLHQSGHAQIKPLRVCADRNGPCNAWTITTVALPDR